ncbi:MAG TPA: glycosyltransferase family 1 protein [Pyrinomonadaceae bacterium]|jgi:glycosyltransferase involved in cell wall biosynthesis|nr:glycosyltransferase family 1 protein [Pyrinomonadaceae bacterium]
MGLPSLAVVCDFREENWPSMDLVADMLLDQLEKNHSHEFAVTRVCPPLRRRFSRSDANAGTLFNVDRFLNRFLDYPQHARTLRSEFDLFHVVDHSYAQLLLDLPAHRTVVTCHDLDTFQSLLNPQREPRSLAFRKMMERTLDGFRRAARVTCDSAATRAELLAHNLVEPQRAVVVPNGVHPSCSPAADANADDEAARLLGEPAGVELLHVGSTIPRKRIDLLLKIFAAVRKEVPAARLVRAGGVFTREQEQLISQLDLARSIVVLPRLERNVLASVYRRAAVVLLPSEREGFGLPIVEALACGTPVVASDLPVLREAGGDAVTYCSIADIRAWTESLVGLLREREAKSETWAERRPAGIGQASKFSWEEYANKLVCVYREILPN